MSSSKEDTVKGVLDDFTGALQSTLPLDHLSQFYDETEFIKSTQNQFRDVQGDFQENSKIDFAETTALLPEIAQQMQGIIEQWKVKNEVNRNKSEEFVQGQVDFLLRDFRTSSEIKLVAVPDISCEDLKVFLEHRMNALIGVFDILTKPGQLQSLVNIKTELEVKLKALEDEAIDKQKSHLEQNAAEKAAKVLEDTKAIIMEMLRQLKSRLEDYEGNDAKGDLVKQTLMEINYYLNGKGSVLREYHPNIFEGILGTTAEVGECLDEEEFEEMTAKEFEEKLREQLVFVFSGDPATPDEDSSDLESNSISSSNENDGNEDGDSFNANGDVEGSERMPLNKIKMELDDLEDEVAEEAEAEYGSNEFLETGTEQRSLQFQNVEENEIEMRQDSNGIDSINPNIQFAVVRSGDEDENLDEDGGHDKMQQNMSEVRLDSSDNDAQYNQSQGFAEELDDDEDVINENTNCTSSSNSIAQLSVIDEVDKDEEEEMQSKTNVMETVNSEDGVVVDNDGEHGRNEFISTWKEQEELQFDNADDVGLEDDEIEMGPDFNGIDSRSSNVQDFVEVSGDVSVDLDEDEEQDTMEQNSRFIDSSSSNVRAATVGNGDGADDPESDRFPNDLEDANVGIVGDSNVSMAMVTCHSNDEYNNRSDDVEVSAREEVAVVTAMATDVLEPSSLEQDHSPHHLAERKKTGSMGNQNKRSSLEDAKGIVLELARELMSEVEAYQGEHSWDLVKEKLEEINCKMRINSKILEKHNPQIYSAVLKTTADMKMCLDEEEFLNDMSGKVFAETLHEQLMLAFGGENHFRGNSIDETQGRKNEEKEEEGDQDRFRVVGDVVVEVTNDELNEEETVNSETREIDSSEEEDDAIDETTNGKSKFVQPSVPESSAAVSVGGNELSMVELKKRKYIKKECRVNLVDIKALASSSHPASAPSLSSNWTNLKTDPKSSKHLCKTIRNPQSKDFPRRTMTTRLQTSCKNVAEEDLRRSRRNLVTKTKKADPESHADNSDEEEMNLSPPKRPQAGSRKSSKNKLRPTVNRSIKDNESSRCPDKISYLYHLFERPTFRCDVCHRKCYKKMFQYHGEYCGKREDPFACKECGKRFSGKSLLEMHSRIHTGEKPFKCSKCSESFAIKENMKRHMQCHDRVSRYICKPCKISFISNKRLHEHNNLKHKGKLPFGCVYCKERFEDMCSLKKHVITHADIRPLSCPSCDISTTTTYNLSRHVQEVHSQPSHAANKLANQAAVAYLLRETNDESYCHVSENKIHSLLVAHIIRKANLKLPEK